MAHVVVIDDDPAVRSVLGRMLRRAGHEVLEAADGATGIRLLHSHRVELALVDIFMPGQGGLSTIPELRRDWPALKVVAISGADQGGPMALEKRATAHGANAFLKKPFETSELLAVIERLLPTRPAPTSPEDRAPELNDGSQQDEP
jgi:CheY-like chemotaxis protein